MTALLLLKLLAVFLVILMLLNARIPLFIAMSCGTILVSVLFLLTPGAVVSSIKGTFRSGSMWSVVLAMYVISVLLYELKLRDRFDGARKAMNGLLKDSRINTAVACIFIGLMPGPATVTICGDMVDNMAGDYLTNSEKAAVSTCLRHIPENIFPTFSGVILACAVSGISMSSFVMWSLPLMLISVFCIYFVYLRKVPNLARDTVGSTKESVRLLFRSLWSLFAAIAVVTILNLETWMVVIVVALINIAVDHLSLQEARESFVRGFEYKSLFGIVMTFVFKDVLVLTGVIEKLPDYFVGLPVSPFLISAILFLFGTIVGGATTAVAAFMVMAQNMNPGGGALLVVCLMGISYAASQIGPTHICTPIISDHFKVTFVQTVSRAIPPLALYCAAVCLYYMILSAVLL